MAAVLSDESDESAYDTEASGVNYPAAITSLGDKASAAKLVDLKREIAGSKAELVGDLASRHAVRASL